MHNSDYYTHNESLLSNVFPFIKVFIYVDWKDLSNIYIDNHKDRYNGETVASLGGVKRNSQKHEKERLEVTDFVLNVGSINQQGNSDIIQNFTGSSSGSITFIREIDHITDINFDLQRNTDVVANDRNVFSVLGYGYEGALADIEIEVGYKNNPTGNNISILTVDVDDNDINDNKCVS